MYVDDAELFQLEAAVRALLPPAVLQSITSCGSNGSSDSTATQAAGAVQGQNGQDKHSHVQGSIQLTAVAVTLQQL